MPGKFEIVYGIILNEPYMSTDKPVFLNNDSERDIESYLQLRGLLNIQGIRVGGYSQHPVTNNQIIDRGYTVGSTVELIYNGLNTEKKFRIIEITSGSMGWAASNLKKLLLERIE